MLATRTFPGRSAARSGALQTEDRKKRRAYDDPGSAVHRYALHR
jgi:predicted DNA-binding WGR domain protein